MPQEELSGVQRANRDLSINGTTGGSVRVTIPATPFKVQANSGTSRPCKYCYVIAPNDNTGEVRMQIGAACTADTGIPIPQDVIESQHGSTNPLRVEIDDVSKLYFIGTTENDLIDILWIN